MRRRWIVVNMLAVSCLLGGCGGGDETPPVTQDEAKSALEFVKKGLESKKKEQAQPAPSTK